jgi:hypothetical protein
MAGSKPLITKLSVPMANVAVARTRMRSVTRSSSGRVLLDASQTNGTVA